MAPLGTLARRAAREWLLWSMLAALLLVGWAIFERVRAQPEARTEPRDVILLTESDLRQLGHSQLGESNYPNWSTLQHAYALSKPQMRESACRTLGRMHCEDDPSEGGNAPAKPGKSGQVVLYLNVK